MKITFSSFLILSLCSYVLASSIVSRQKRAVCANNADCNSNGVCSTGICKCNVGYNGAKCENQCFPVDIVFLLDESGSVTEPNWKEQLKFTNELIDIFPIGLNKTRVGYVTFSSGINKKRQLKDTPDKTTLKNIISQLSYVGGSTNTPKGITEAMEISFSNANGNRIVNPSVPDVMIIMTDGKVSDKYESELEPVVQFLRIKKIEVFVIGISSGVNDTQLTMMASDPKADHKFIAKDFNDLKNVKNQLLNSICQSTAKTVDPCASNPCFAAGTAKCVNVAGKSTCECKPGYVGTACQTKCGLADIVWIIDSSGSIKADNFVKQKNFIKDFVSRLDISPTASQIGAVSFGISARTDFNLKKFSNKANLVTAINNIPYMNSWTNTSGGIYKAMSEVLTVAGGDRLNIPNIAIVITDGASNKDSAKTIPYAEELQKYTALGVAVFCVAVGPGVKLTEVKGIASDPDDQFVISVSDYSSLNKHIDKILEGTCKSSNADHCASTPCKNGGTCNKAVNGYKCTCKTGFTGNNCQTNIDDCKSSPCGSNGNCTDLINAYKCICKNGYTGVTCQKAPTTPAPQCDKPDICIINDASASIGLNNWPKVLNFIADFSRRFIISDTAARIGVITFSTVANISFPITGFNSPSNNIEFEDKARAIPYMRRGTYTHVGLNKAPQCGWRNEAGIKKIVIVITDGQSIDAPATLTASDGVRTFGAQVHALGIMNYDQSELDAISGKGKLNAGKTYTAPDFDSLGPIIADLAQGVCNIAPGSPCTPNPCRNGGSCSQTTNNNYKCTCSNGFTGVNCQTAPITGNTCAVADICFVIDASASIGLINWPKQQEFIAKFGDSFTIADDKTKIGAITFSSTTEKSIPVSGIGSAISSANFRNMVKNIQYMRRGTYTNLGIDSMNNGCGWRPASPLIRRLGIVVTDGLSIDTAATCASANRARNNHGIEVHAIGIQNYDLSELNCISGIGQAKAGKSYTASDFDQLDPIVTALKSGLCNIASDPCNPNQCKNGAKCTPGGSNGYTCDCLPGFSGSQCGIVANQCDPNPCNGGFCQPNALTSFTCFCASPNTGSTCQFNPCNKENIGNPCLNNAKCSISGAGFVCSCANGFTGLTCDKPLDPCLSSPCKNGGNCLKNSAGYSCNCIGGFTGNQCQTAPDPCLPNPCNGGFCQPNGTAAYQCFCASPNFGPSCQFNPCYLSTGKSPCFNNGKCTVSGSTYTCACINGYTGLTCNTSPDSCSSSPCKNGGVCTSSVSGHTCQCFDSFWGANCQNNPGCTSKPCLNGGSCKNGANGAFTCTCTNVFTGKTCNTAVTTTQAQTPKPTTPRNTVGCGVCTGAECTSAAMTVNNIYATSGGTIKNCPSCYSKLNTDGSITRGCVSDLDGPTLGIPTNAIPSAGSSVCYPLDDGTEICLCQGSQCNLKAQTGPNSLGGGFEYEKGTNTCNCSPYPCKNDDGSEGRNPFKCFNDPIFVPCNCDKCSCDLSTNKRKKRWISWLW